ncbi:MAG: low molecular weight phosphatase family protein [Gaiellaceae bacterium]
MNVLFVCIGNSGRSVMAERLFRRAGEGRHETRSAGAAPSGTSAEPTVVAALRELGIDASDHLPRRLDDEALSWADIAVTVCHEDVCPATPGVRLIHWGFEDPWGRSIEEVRPIRDAILERVEALAAELR